MNSDLPDKLFGEIKDLYKKRLKLPEAKPKKQFLLCPVGLVGSGKSTVLKPLAEKLNAVRVSVDEIRQTLKESGFNYNQARNIAYEIIQELLDSGQSVAVDGNCGSEDALKKIEQLKMKPEKRIVWIRVNPPEEFIINKLKNFKHTWLFDDGDEAVRGFYKYKEKYGDFSDLRLPYAYTFDTSKDDLGEQINEALKIIKDKINL